MRDKTRKPGKTPIAADIATGGDPHAWSAGVFDAYFPGARCCSKSYVHRQRRDRCSRTSASTDNTCSSTQKRQLVIAKVSSHGLPLDAALIASTFGILSKLRPTLAG